MSSLPNAVILNRPAQSGFIHISDHRSSAPASREVICEYQKQNRNVKLLVTDAYKPSHVTSLLCSVSRESLLQSTNFHDQSKVHDFYYIRPMQL